MVSLCQLAKLCDGLKKQEGRLVCATFVKQKLNFPLLLVSEVDLLIGEGLSPIGEVY